MRVSLAQAAATGIILLAVILACGYLLLPLAYYSYGSVKIITGVIRSDKGKEIDEYNKENQALADMLGGQAEAGQNNNAQWYAFLQSTMERDSIITEKINAHEMITQDGNQREDFSFNTKNGYREIGRFVADIENGPYISRIASMHLVAPSLLSADLAAQITISFYKKSAPSNPEQVNEE